jgi:hypothetical protein
MITAKAVMDSGRTMETQVTPHSSGSVSRVALMPGVNEVTSEGAASAVQEADTSRRGYANE